MQSWAFLSQSQKPLIYAESLARFWLWETVSCTLWYYYIIFNLATCSSHLAPIIESGVASWLPLHPASQSKRHVIAVWSCSSYLYALPLLSSLKIHQPKKNCRITQTIFSSICALCFYWHKIKAELNWNKCRFIERATAIEEYNHNLYESHLVVHNGGRLPWTKHVWTLTSNGAPLI